MENRDKKLFYFFVGCFLFAIAIIGATYAYFTAKSVDENTVKGNATTVNFGLTVERVTTVDMAYGLVPMRNNQAPNAAKKKCYDDLGRAGCQMYKITVLSDSDVVMFLDGYVYITTKDEELETRVTTIFTDDGENYYTGFTNEDMLKEDFSEEKYIKTGMVTSNEEFTSPNRTRDFNNLLFLDEKIGGDVGRAKTFYMMIWVYDNGKAQDYLQGMQLAYNGKVTFVTAEGNEISATFD